MSLLYVAATDSGPGAATLILIAVIAAVAYMIHCLIYPYRSCRYCDAGKHRSATGKTWRYCKHCKGKNAQLRAGRRIWTYLKNTHDRGSK